VKYREVVTLGGLGAKRTVPLPSRVAGLVVLLC